MVDISIIIPTHNRLWCLPKAIESCRNTKCITEIIVVDDGSTDGTWEWLQKQKEITTLQQQHLGKCWAVNKAFALSKGKYIKFLDSDDMLAEGTIDEQYHIAEGNLSDIVVSGYELVDENNQLIRKQTWTECDDFIAQQLGECDSSHYSAYLFKRSLIEDIPHRPDYALRDDRLFVLESALKLPKVDVHPGFALIHTQHKKSRLQNTHGMLQIVQNYQHLNLYKNILSQLKEKGWLTPRRVSASLSILWPLCHWIAKDNIKDAISLLTFMFELDPKFKIPETGALGLMYNRLGFETTEHILKIRRRIIHR